MVHDADPCRVHRIHPDHHDQHHLDHHDPDHPDHHDQHHQVHPLDLVQQNQNRESLLQRPGGKRPAHPDPRLGLMDEADRRFPPVHDQERRPEFALCERWCHLSVDLECGSSVDECRHHLEVDVPRYLAVAEFCDRHLVAVELHVHSEYWVAIGQDARPVRWRLKSRMLER